MKTAEEYADEALSKMDASPHEPFTRDEIIKAYKRYGPKETGLTEERNRLEIENDMLRKRLIAITEWLVYVLNDGEKMLSCFQRPIGKTEKKPKQQAERTG